MAQKKAVKKTEKKVVKSEAKNAWAVVAVSGRQFIVEKGGEYTVNSLGKDKGSKFSTSEVLLVVEDGKVKIGKPFVKGATVDFEVVANKKDKKVTSFKYKAKARYRKTIGSRSHLTRIAVKKISA